MSLINCTSKTTVLIPHNRPTLGLEEESAALRVIRSGWVAKGKEVESFQNEFCEFMGLPKGHAVAVSSGTVENFTILESADLNKIADLAKKMSSTYKEPGK